ncbi:(5-formylfuran-3-yl)methyl phosphate synthase [Rubinisphaera italica]|uniref:(5-formylfuran-3-yl)methyl phosphate synthase n=1 Tax=Rubinisphaera italica TaxID=2527969 RepID=A0A5C5XJ67_9PLAN|nr:(5-formylfuran-3-yl)methyl phosphate synthase [Rubinisphaera italica]TWT63227.1 hypothetical protein Pan54_39800 [Rubinisphaera italica]
MPQLLISVRSSIEATAAIAGGCYVLDIKEPENGPLGMASADVITQIFGQIPPEHSDILKSVALGELHDWSADRRPDPILSQANILKVGPGDFEDIAGWIRSLKALIHRFQHHQILTNQFIAVIYADTPLGQLILSQSPNDQLQLFHELRAISCTGLLIDTQNKTAGCLTKYATETQLLQFCNHCQQANLTSALAGSLQLDEVTKLMNSGIKPNYFGFRSAACVSGIRTHEIDAELVRDLKRYLR